MRSLRRDLVVGAILAAATAFLAGGVVLYLLIRGSLIQQFDQQLIDSARLFASTVEQEKEGLDTEFEDLDMREFRPPHPRAYLQLWLADGATLFRSPSLGQANLPRIAGAPSSPACQWATLPNHERGRAAGMTFTPRVDLEDDEEDEDDDDDDDDDKEGDKEEDEEEDEDGSVEDAKPAAVTLVLARGTAVMDAVLMRLGMLLISVGVLTVTVAAGALWGIVRRSLRPVDQLATQIGQLDEEDLSATVETRPPLKELLPVTQRLNELLRRLDDAFQRERSFSGAVAHELRTPLAGLRSTLEVTLSRPRQSREYTEALTDCLQIAMRMQAMIENLLALARLDTGRVERHFERVVPSEVIRDLWKPLAALAAARRLQVEWALSTDAAVSTDPSLFALVIRNILENAVDYAGEGGRATIAAEVTDHRVDVRVSNSGSKLSEEEVQHVFDRFWRGNSSRSGTGIHCGLGLSLVQAAATFLGGATAVRSSVGGEFEITVSVPQGAPAPAPQAAGSEVELEAEAG